jgi:hypothetical protein
MILVLLPLIDFFALPISNLLQTKFLESKFNLAYCGIIWEWTALAEAKIGYNYFMIKSLVIEQSHEDMRDLWTLKFHYDFMCNYP